MTIVSTFTCRTAEATSRESGNLRNGAPPVPDTSLRSRLRMRRENFTYEDLGNALRKIRIDLNIPITFRDEVPALRDGNRNETMRYKQLALNIHRRWTAKGRMANSSISSQ